MWDADCAQKAKFYLKHEAERVRITQAYYDRTKAEHLWQHRFTRLLQEIGLQVRAVSRTGVSPVPPDTRGLDRFIPRDASRSGVALKEDSAC